MKLILKDGRRYILRFDKGEEVFFKLTEFLSQENISTCSFTGVGACSEVELGYFNVNLKDYRKKPFYEDLEIVSVTGNSSMADGKPFLHGHGIFGRTDFSTIGGHVFKIVVSVTCEIFLISLDGQAVRKLDPNINLKLLE